MSFQKSLELGRDEMSPVVALNIYFFKEIQLIAFCKVAYIKRM